MFEIYVKMKKKKCWKLAIEVPNAWGWNASPLDVSGEEIPSVLRTGRS